MLRPRRHGTTARRIPTIMIAGGQCVVRTIPGEAAMQVRDMNGNPAIWEELSWADLSSREKELWTALGWSQSAWDRNEAPASADKDWSELSGREQIAAMNLGFTEALWNSTEDE
jgi:hypothetical protein